LVDTSLDEPVRIGYSYQLDDIKFHIPDMSIQVKIGNFDISSIENMIENELFSNEDIKKLGISAKKNQYYDMHYFLNTLNKYYQNVMPDVITEFIHRVIPRHFRYPCKKMQSMVDY